MNKKPDKKKNNYIASIKMSCSFHSSLTLTWACDG